MLFLKGYNNSLQLLKRQQKFLPKTSWCQPPTLTSNIDLLCRMASFLCGHEVFQISASATYGLVEFKADLLSLYSKAGSKGTKVTFLLTDTNIVNERFLVYINDLLSTGYIADLCTPVSLNPPFLCRKALIRI